jgi:hypothetical protein
MVDVAIVMHWPSLPAVTADRFISRTAAGVVTVNPSGARMLDQFELLPLARNDRGLACTVIVSTGVTDRVGVASPGTSYVTRGLANTAVLIQSSALVSGSRHSCRPSGLAHMDDVDSRCRRYAAPRATCHGDSAAVAAPAQSPMGTGRRIGDAQGDLCWGRCTQGHPHHGGHRRNRPKTRRKDGGALTAGQMSLVRRLMICCWFTADCAFESPLNELHATAAASGMVRASANLTTMANLRPLP